MSRDSLAQAEPVVSPMDRYHQYLSENYEGGCERFFSPTGFLEKFQRNVEVRAQSARNHVFASSVDDAQAKLEPAVAGKEGVFDLTAEPGTGKTSVLPFRFPSKRIIVALPTPFDAWSAYNMATGPCRLILKGLKLGGDYQVIYTDSYMAAAAVLAGIMNYDIMIVDECDSDRGVSKFLAEVKAPGKLLIRMSATHGRNDNASSKTFRVTTVEDMPDIRESVREVADYVVKHHKHRSLVLAPDADSALNLASHIPSAFTVTTKSSIGDIARTIVKQEGEAIFIADDTCARGVNFNLDAMFDCQLVTEYSMTRVITNSEAIQRKNRVGRNKAGWYRSPGLKFCEKRSSDIDVVRLNVVRAIAELPQLGSSRLHLSLDQAKALMCSPVEPFETLALNAATSTPSPPNSDDSSVSLVRTYNTPPTSPSRSVNPPSWLGYFSGMTNTLTGDVDVAKPKSYVVKTDRGELQMQRRYSHSRSSNESVRSATSVKSSGSWFTGESVHGRHQSKALMRTAPTLPVVSADAPYSVSRRREPARVAPMHVPSAPPLMDLTELTYDMDWPSLIRDRLSKGGDLPTLVPPGSWRHTSSSGLGTDWFRRLDDLAYSDNRFDGSEFEVVCRAWNKLVAQSWIRKTPGLSNESDLHRMEYCMRYFQSYFLLSSAG